MDSALRSAKLKPLLVFGEEVIASENREYEEMFALHELHQEFYESILNRDKHWCLDRMEIFSEEDDKEYLTFCKTLLPEELISNSNQTILIVGEAGGGKTCLLRHLWAQCQQTYAQRSDDPTNYMPIYISAKQIFMQYIGQIDAKPENFEFNKMMKAIAVAATKEIDMSVLEYTETQIEEFIFKLFDVQKILLLVDDLDLIPLDQLQPFIHFFKSSSSCELPGSRKQECFSGKVILAARNTSFGGILPFSQVETLINDLQCVELLPGFTFNILTTSQIRSLLKRWSVIEKASAVNDSISQWVAFEDGLRAHRRKLYPSCTHSPILLFILARRLAKGTLTDVDQGTDREFNIYELLDDLYNDSLREQYFGFTPYSIVAPEYVARSSDSAAEGNDPMEISEDISNPVESITQQTEAAKERAKEKFPILHGYDLDIAQLKRLCSLIGFLCHWSTPRCLSSESMATRQILNNRLAQRPFIHLQLKHLLAQPGIANLLGFDAMDDSESSSSKLELSDDEITRIIDEIFEILSYFYDVSVDGRTQIKHPILEEFICAKFLTEPSYFYNLVTQALTSTVIHESKSLTLRTFQWSDSFYQTDWWWDGVFQFAGIRRGVVWLAGKILHGTLYDTKQPTSKSNKQQQQQQAIGKGKSATKQNSPHPAPRGGNRDQEIFEYFLRNIQSIGVDVEDLGQIRYQILLRVYSSICNHRSAIENSNDPITDWMGKAFSGLVERSLTVFVHLEVFPNYFLSAFNASVCNNIIKRCISIFVKRSTHHAIHLISKFHFSSYLQRHLPSLLDIYTRRDAKSRQAIFNILKNIDLANLEKTNVADMVQMLGDFDGNVRRDVVSELMSLGVASSQQIEDSLLFDLFEGGDPLPVISDAVSALTNLVEYTDDIDSTPQQMLHSKHTSTITALLEQPDPGTRLLAYICFGSPNFKHNADETDGIPARKAALHVCARLRSTSDPAPIFASSSMENIGMSDQKIRGDYCYTVALNTLITNTLGETAACWVSSAMDLLKFKKFLIQKVSALAFSSLPLDSQQNIFEELVNDSNYVIHSQIFQVILLVTGLELRSCVSGIHKYIVENIVSSKVGCKIPPFVKTLAMKVYCHIAQILPHTASLVLLCDVIFSLPSPSVIHEAILGLQRIPLASPTPRCSSEEFSALARIIINSIHVEMHFIASEALSTIGNMSSDCIDVTQIPLEEILRKSFGSVRQSCIYMVDKHPLLFKNHIRGLCELFKTQGNLKSCYIRSAAVSTLACMARRGLSENIVSTIVSGGFLDAQQHPYFVVEAAVRTLSLVPVNSVTNEAKTKVFALLYHRSHRVTVAVIDALGVFAEQMLDNEDEMLAFTSCLRHSDSEIRSATQNALERIKERKPICDKIKLTNGIEKLFGEFVASEEYYQRMAAVHLFKFYGTPAMIKLNQLLSLLLQDSAACVRIELLTSLREFIGDQDLYSCLRDTFVDYMEQKEARTPEDNQVMRETFRLLRCAPAVAKDVATFAKHSLNAFFEDVQVKKQAVLLLSSIDELDNENVQSLVDMLKTNDARILTEVANVFARAGLPFVRLIPKMFGYMKGDHPTVKRKLLRFIAPFKDQVKDEYVQHYHHIINMTNDTDSVVRKKAAELLTMVACSLPVDLPDGLTNTVTTAIIEALVEINLDRNSFVRREAAVALSEIGASQPQFIPLIHRKLLKIDDDPFSNILIWRLFSFRWGVLIEKQPKSAPSK